MLCTCTSHVKYLVINMYHDMYICWNFCWNTYIVYRLWFRCIVSDLIQNLQQKKPQNIDWNVRGLPKNVSRNCSMSRQWHNLILYSVNRFCTTAQWLKWHVIGHLAYKRPIFFFKPSKSGNNSHLYWVAVIRTEHTCESFQTH